MRIRRLSFSPNRGAVRRLISVNNPRSMSEHSPELSINRNITAYILMESRNGWKCVPLFRSLYIVLIGSSSKGSASRFISRSMLVSYSNRSPPSAVSGGR